MNPLLIIDMLAGKWLDWRTWQRIKAEATTEAELIDLQVSRQKGIEIVLSHPNVANLAAECVHFLQSHDAPNYVQMELHPRIEKGSRAVIVTVAYKDGEMPATQNARLKREILSIYERISHLFPGYSTEPGLWHVCFFCGQEIEQRPENHAENCLWAEARAFCGELVNYAAKLH